MDKKLITSNLLWRLAERFGAQGVTLVVSLVLARLLNPEVYASLALVTVITTVLQVFLDAGFSNALIQKKEADDTDFSSVFYFNLVTGVLLYIGLFFAAPILAEYYRMPDLTEAIRALGLTIIIFSLKSVQQAYISRNMMFRTFFFATLGGTIGAAIIGITLAVLGYGIWALVLQHIFNMLVDTIILWVMVKWRPKKTFSWKRLRILLAYGWKLLVSGLIDTVYNSLRKLIIGRVYTASDLAYYDQGQKYTEAIVTNINASIDSVLLPTLSSQQDSTEIVRKMTSRAIRVSTYIMMPIMAGIAACAEPLVRFLLTDKWLPCVPYMRIFCFTFSFYPIHTANLNAIKAVGRSDLFLKLEIIKKIVGILSILLTVQYGPMTMAYSLLIVSILNQIINSWPNKKLLKYSYLEQMRDIIPHIGLSGAMGIIVYLISLLHMPDIITLFAQISLGVTVYIVLSKELKIECFQYILDIIKQYLPHKANNEEVSKEA